LARIESEVFYESSLESIIIPRNVEILGSNCFSYCKSLSSITFESNSRLIRIELGAFYKSSLRSILIPSNVEILGSKCYFYCKSHSSITFESNSHLRRIESEVFCESSLQSILRPGNVEILGSNCFSSCESLLSIAFESNSGLTPRHRLKVIPEEAFSFSRLISIVIPATVRIVEKRAFLCCHSLTELLWTERSEVKVIEEEAFEHTGLERLEIPGSLQYIGARMCPARTELLLTRESRIPKFEKWKASFMLNRNEVMGTRSAHEMEEHGQDG
jgi:hypothetical protein